MQASTIRQAALAFVLATSLPLLACSDDNDTPTSPTQPGPPVGEPAPPPTPPPTDPPPTPAPPPTDNRPIVTITGPITIPFTRGGEGGLDVSFRIDDFTIVHVAGSTPVITMSGSAGDTTHLLQGQTVTVEGRRNNGTLDATRVTIVSQP